MTHVYEVRWYGDNNCEYYSTRQLAEERMAKLIEAGKVLGNPLLDVAIYDIELKG